MEGLRLYWLGDPTVELKGRPVKLETRKCAALLAYLSLGGKRYQREAVATIFWPEASQQKAFGSLRRTLSALNSRLPGWIEADRETIGIKKTGKLWCDVAEFHEVLARVQRFCSAGKELGEESRAALEEASRLYRGDFLDGLSLADAPEFDDWEMLQREELRRELGEALQRLALAYSRSEKWDQAIQAALRWVALDRMYQPAHRMLMGLYVRSGKRSAALRQYEQLQRLLKQQQADVEEETLRLYEEIRGPQPESLADDRSAYPSRVPILKTKLYIATAPASRIERVHLVDKLRQVEQHKLTLISAPAGFGKTTLLAEWIARSPLPVAWLSVDTGDNDPYRFLAYLIAALESIYEGVGAEVKQLVQSPRPMPWHVLLSSLMNDLGRISEPYALVLDDYQFATEHAVHEVVSYLLDHSPPNLHLVVATRSDPPIQLGRLRAHGQMLELRTQDLRFTTEETADFLNASMGLGLSRQDIQALDARTEGWAVGLQMAALSLKGHGNPGEFIRDFTGSHRYVLDYLVEEVLRQQPAHIQTFLLQTSILEKLNGSLCDAIMAEEWKRSAEAGQEVLEYLERSNLFLIALDSSRQWYRYHHLFAELLEARLQGRQSDELPELHRRASLWYEEHGFHSEAIHHSLAAKDFPHVAHLVERLGNAAWARNEGHTLSGWIDAIPELEFESRPRLNVYRAWVLLHDAHFDEARKYLDCAQQSIAEGHLAGEPGSYAAETRGMIHGLRAIVLVNLDESALAISEAKGALQLLPENNAFWRSLSLLVLGASYELAGDTEQAHQAFAQSNLFAQTANCPALSILISYNLAATQLVQGRLHMAYEHYCQTLLMAEQYRIGRLHELGETHADLAWLFCEWNDLESAEKHMDLGREIGRQIESGLITATCHLIQARILQIQGDLGGALGEVGQALRVAETHHITPYVEAAGSFEARLRLMAGDLEQASRWAQKCERLAPTGAEKGANISVLNLDAYALTLARVWFSEGKTADALKWLDAQLAVARCKHRLIRVIEILLLRVVFMHALGDHISAWANLEEALTLAEPQSYIRAFADEGNAVASVLVWGMEHDELHVQQLRMYAEKLLRIIQTENRGRGPN